MGPSGSGLVTGCYLGSLGFGISGSVLYGFQKGSVRGGSLSGITVSGMVSGSGGAIVPYEALTFVTFAALEALLITILSISRFRT